MSVEPDVYLSSVGDLVDWLRDAAPADTWFRGQAQDWEPRPALERDAVRASVLAAAHTRLLRMDPKADLASGIGNNFLAAWVEPFLNQEFVRGASSLPDAPRSNVEAYFMAQHHRLPTRLLDWTVNPLTAIYFAVAESPVGSDEDGALFALNPAHWTRVTFDSADDDEVLANPVAPDSNVVKRAVGMFFEDRRFVHEVNGLRLQGVHATSPIAILPHLAVARMFAQGSCFTLHLPGCGGFPADHLQRAVVPARAKSRLRDELGLLGVSRAALFVDAESISEGIKKRWDLP